MKIWGNCERVCVWKLSAQLLEVFQVQILTLPSPEAGHDKPLNPHSIIILICKITVLTGAVPGGGFKN